MPCHLFEWLLAMELLAQGSGAEIPWDLLKVELKLGHDEGIAMEQCGALTKAGIACWLVGAWPYVQEGIKQSANMPG